MKNYLIRVNGNEYEVEVEEISNNSGEKKSIVQQTASPKQEVKKTVQKVKREKEERKKVENVPQGAESIDAPMPGTILSIDVNEGDEVKAGQVLLILEAMKMENEILSPRDGKVAAIYTTKGTSVNTGDKLVSIE